MIDYRNILVRKPWGHEYLLYQNPYVGVWYLHIEHGNQTSFHCHPRKKTGLILLSGEAVVSFFGDSAPLKSVGKLNIREGLFHSTAALSPEGISVLEIESPPDKSNLVRLDDAYGREQLYQEALEELVPRDDRCLWLDLPENGLPSHYVLAGCTLTIQSFQDAEALRHRDLEETVVVLEGGLVSRTGEPILNPGDVVSAGTLDRLANSFSAPHGATLLMVSKKG